MRTSFNEISTNQTPRENLEEAVKSKRLSQPTEMGYNLR